MGIAFSRKSVWSSEIYGADSTEFISDLDNLLRRVNWTPLEALEGGGFKYRLESNQFLSCRCIVRPHEGFPDTRVIVQFTSDDETIFGVEHELRMVPGRTFFAIAGHCQMFLCLPEYAEDSHGGEYGHAVSGGIPYIEAAELGSVVSGQCAQTVSSNLTVEAWWSCGSGVLFGGDNFRYSLTCSPSTWSACHNGVDYHTSGGVGDTLRIFPLRHPNSATWPSGEYTAFVDDSPIYIDPLLGWGTHDGQPRVRGQIWDAMLASKDMPLDEEIVTEETDVNSQDGFGVWRNYTHYTGSMVNGEPHSYNGSLYLLHRVLQDPEPSNYAY